MARLGNDCQILDLFFAIIKIKLFTVVFLACITAASSAKPGERGILRETSAKRETNTVKTDQLW